MTDTTNYDDVIQVWSDECGGYVETPKYKFRPGQTVWVWWGCTMVLKKAKVIRFLYSEHWHQKWAVTSDMPNRPNGLAACSDDMYATHEEAVAACSANLLASIEAQEARIEQYRRALERLGV